MNAHPTLAEPDLARSAARVRMSASYRTRIHALRHGASGRRGHVASPSPSEPAAPRARHHARRGDHQARWGARSPTGNFREIRAGTSRALAADMKSLALLALLPLAILACESDSSPDAASPARDDAGATEPPRAPSEPPGSRLEAGAADAGAEAAPTADAGGTTCDAPDGGLPCDPGIVRCGAESCATPGEACCISQSGGAPSATCQPKGATCNDPIVELGCDETGDCAAGEICCSSMSPSGAPKVACAASCGTYGMQVCRSSSECTNGEPCVVQTCQGNIVQTCGKLPAQAGCQ